MKRTIIFAGFALVMIATTYPGNTTEQPDFDVYRFIEIALLEGYIIPSVQ
ncbi:MAG TPA: hypothetical protein VMW76_02875 [Bacteroidales bacterium]|nr:hypothetical protein [Bacteroidales bacterium]